MIINLGKTDRIIRVTLGVLLILAPFVTGMFQSTLMTIVAVIVGIVLIATSAMKFCPLYRLLGIRTCKL